MRRLALASLCAVTGCNWVFGLEATVAVDALPPEVLPPGPRTKLLWAVATSDGVVEGGVDPKLEHAPFGSEPTRKDVPVIQVGDETGLTDAPYNVDDGSFEIPYRLRESPHRIVYLLPGESVPHEVQWALTGATLVVPRTTRLGALPVPVGSGYAISPMGMPGSLAGPALYTSGVMTYANVSSDFEQAASTVTFRFAVNGKPLAGPLGAPQAEKGDWVLLADWVSRAGTQASVDGWALANVNLVPNTMAMPVPEPTWRFDEVTLTTVNGGIPGSNSAQVQQRLTNTLGGLHGTPVTRMAYGISPSTQLAGFLPGGPPTYVERPLMLPLAESGQLDTQVVLADPSSSLTYKRVVFHRIGSSRTVDGVVLISSINAITETLNVSMQYPAPLVTNIRLGTQSLGGDAVDNVPVAPSSSTLRLTFEQEAGYAADDFVVTLYDLTSGALSPLRIYHVIQPEVKVDGSMLAKDGKYVLAITARSGFGGADRGDYTIATYPFGSTTTFTRTFVIQ